MNIKDFGVQISGLIASQYRSRSRLNEHRIIGVVDGIVSYGLNTALAVD